MKWEQGRAPIDDMLARGELERVAPSRDHADLLLAQAHQHVKAAEADDVSRDVPKVQQIVDLAARVLDQMSPY